MLTVDPAERASSKVVTDDIGFILFKAGVKEGLTMNPPAIERTVSSSVTPARENFESPRPGALPDEAGGNLTARNDEIMATRSSELTLELTLFKTDNESDIIPQPLSRAGSNPQSVDSIASGDGEDSKKQLQQPDYVRDRSPQPSSSLVPLAAPAETSDFGPVKIVTMDQLQEKIVMERLDSTGYERHTYTRKHSGLRVEYDQSRSKTGLYQPVVSKHDVPGSDFESLSPMAQLEAQGEMLKKLMAMNSLQIEREKDRVGVDARLIRDD